MSTPKVNIENSTPPIGFVQMPAMTFALTGEDHTLGNAIRGVLCGNLEVEFVGCSIPHPTEPEMNLRVQTYGKPAVQVLNNGLEDLIQICDHILTIYQKTLDDTMIKSDN